MDAQTCMNQCSQATDKENCKNCVFVNVEGEFELMGREHCSPSTVIVDDEPAQMMNGNW